MVFKKGQIPPNKGKKQSLEHRRKNSESHIGQKSWNKGMKMSEEFIRKNSESHMGQKPWNKGVPRTPEEKEAISKALIGKTKGRPKSEDHKRKIGLSNKNKKRTPEQCKHNSEIHIGLQAREKHPLWKGGISPLNTLIRTSVN
jgi:hypothetical protein